MNKTFIKIIAGIQAIKSINTLYIAIYALLTATYHGGGLDGFGFLIYFSCSALLMCSSIGIYKQKRWGIVLYLISVLPSYMFSSFIILRAFGVYSFVPIVFIDLVSIIYLLTQWKNFKMSEQKN